MEEILASIRRIIADDDTAKTAAKGGLRQMGEGATVSSRTGMLPARMTTSARPAAAPHPAMPQEEIDDMLARLQASTMQAAAALDEQDADDLDATDEMTALEQGAEPAPGGHTSGTSEAVFDDGPPEPPASQRPPADQLRQRPETGDDDALISAATTAAVDCAFSTLAQTAPAPSGRTLEDVVRDMLRPMLKSWLDDNLPSMVERLVRAEIERVSRARG
jgi:cell pole-organizing protein PopZ